MRIGILTGGGDAPGLNGVIEAATRTLLNSGHEVIGICDGFEGIFNKRILLLTLAEIDGIHAFAGTMLGSSNKSGTDGRERQFVNAYKELKLDGLIVAGGDGTFRGLQEVEHEIKVVGVPKTIDNDLSGTDATFGYDTACSVVSESVDSLRATATAHQRIIVVETMGRTAGWIALGGGMASMADAILIPERPVDHEALKKFLIEKTKHQRGIVVVVSEGVTLEAEVERRLDKSGESFVVHEYGIGRRLAKWLDREIDREARHVVLGHLQRSHPPTTTDRFLTTAMGIVAAQLAHSQKWGQAAAFKDGKVTDVPISDLMGQPRVVDKDHRWVQMCKALGIFI